MENFEALEKKSAEDVLRWAIEKFYPKIAFASSFGAEDVVLIDMIFRINPKVRMFTLDTGRLHQETYDVMDEIRRKYNKETEIYFPEAREVEAMVRQYGLNLFYDSIDLRKMCCRVRKILPLNRALSGLDAWITGLRREQAVTRGETKKVEIDSSHNSIIKVNPIVNWTDKEVWDYIKKNNIPYNKLHDKGFPSIGCVPCTRAIKKGEDIRAGRWWWENPETKECGLHCAEKKKR